MFITPMIVSASSDHVLLALTVTWELSDLSSDISYGPYDVITGKFVVFVLLNE